ncbi:thiol reductant ABC exporter subunit CydD (plasmid) [Thioclava litoralis]|uniref:Thiol reductant ABC exporter subunit CydD n=1 Tax=Thioclava litoralis TaxID=3076557 RepID=A0ABZ1E3H5_9RHOB|nr:thiol reductant ABC exporter subunit CydD [Thioclava sp. FTW29]
MSVPARPQAPRPLHGDAVRPIEGWLRRHGLAGRSVAALSVCAAVGSGAMVVLQAYATARMITAVVVDGVALSSLQGDISLFIISMMLRAILDVLREGLAFEAGGRIRAHLRRIILQRIGHARLQDLPPSGEVAGILSEGVEAVQDYFAAFLPQRLVAALIPVLVLVCVIPFDWVSALILAVTAPVIPVFMIVVGKGAEALNRRQWQRLMVMGAHLFDRIAGLVTLRQLGAARREAALVAAMSEGYRSVTMKVLRLAFLSSLVLEFFSTIAVAMVAVYVGFRLYYGDLTFLPGLFALLVAPEFFRPLREMGQHYHARMAAIGAGEAMMALIGPDQPAATGIAAAGIAPRDWRMLRVEALSFTHADRSASTDVDGDSVGPLSFTLERGRSLAVMGASGAGKTTLARLLLGQVSPSSGQILLDGQTIAAQDLRAGIGWLPQTPRLFAGTLAENIALGQPAATQARIEAAARAPQAHGFISALPEGYATRLGEGGAGLSGGQIRRVAMARALLVSPALLILDEPTAALDAQGAQALMRSVLAATPDAARLIITHDRACAQLADHLIMLQAGKVVFDGPPQDLPAAFFEAPKEVRDV